MEVFISHIHTAQGGKGGELRGKPPRPSGFIPPHASHLRPPPRSSSTALFSEPRQKIDPQVREMLLRGGTRGLKDGSEDTSAAAEIPSELVKLDDPAGRFSPEPP